jgi:hypothetical protein
VASLITSLPVTLPRRAQDQVSSFDYNSPDAPTCDLKLPQGRHQSSLPNFFKFASADHLRAWKVDRPLRLSAEFPSHERSVVIAPMGPIIPHHVAVRVRVDLPDYELILNHFPILDNSSPVRVVEALIEFARGGQTGDPTWCLEIS